jgi:site-specific recombinase XerC
VIEHFWPSYLPVAYGGMRAVELNLGHIQQREEHWAIVDLKGKAGHTRTIPMPGWVKNVVEQWIQAANITSANLFRRVHKMGKTWGERLTERRSGTWFGSMPRRLGSTS